MAHDTLALRKKISGQHTHNKYSYTYIYNRYIYREVELAPVQMVVGVPVVVAHDILALRKKISGQHRHTTQHTHMCSACGSTHIESGKLYRRVKHRSPPKSLLSHELPALTALAQHATHSHSGHGEKRPTVKFVYNRYIYRGGRVDAGSGCRLLGTCRCIYIYLYLYLYIHISISISI